MLLPVAISLELLQGLLPQPDQGLSDFVVAFGRIIRELFLEDLLVLYHCGVESGAAFVLGHLLPGCPDGGHFMAVECLDEGLDQFGHDWADDWLPAELLGIAALDQLISEVAHSLNEFLPECVVGDVVESLQLALVPDRPHHGDALSLCEVTE